MVKKCPKCGAETRDTSKFCPKCGLELSEYEARVEAADVSESVKSEASADIRPEAQQKPKKKRVALIVTGVVLAAAALVCAGVFTAMRFIVSPDREFLLHHQDMLSGHMLESVAKSLDYYGKGEFSSDLSITAGTDSVMINRYLDGSKLELKLDADNDGFAANGEMEITGNKILSASAYYDEGEAGLYVPELDGNMYVCNIEKMFGEELAGAGFDIPEFSAEELGETLLPYLEMLVSTVNKDNVSVERSAKFTILYGNMGSEEYTGDIYTFAPGASDITGTLKNLAGRLEKDGNLRELIRDCADSGLLEAMGISSVSEIDGKLNEWARSMHENAGNIGKLVEESGFSWKLCVSGDDVRRIVVGTDDVPNGLVYEQTVNSGRHTINVLASYNENAYRLTNVYTVQSGMYSGVLSFNDQDQNIFTLEYKTEDKERSVLGIPFGNYGFSSSLVDYAVKAKVGAGTGSEGDVHEVVVDNLKTVTGGAVGIVNLRINASRTGTAKRMNGPTVDITNYSENQMAELAGKLGDEFNRNIASRLGPMLF